MLHLEVSVNILELTTILVSTQCHNAFNLLKRQVTRIGRIAASGIYMVNQQYQEILLK